MMKYVIPFLLSDGLDLQYWRSATDIVIFSSSNVPLSIFVLGEAYEVIAISMCIGSGTDE